MFAKQYNGGRLSIVGSQVERQSRHSESENRWWHYNVWVWSAVGRKVQGRVLETQGKI